MQSYDTQPNPATIPLDSLPGSRCRRACDRLRHIRQGARSLGLTDVVALRRGPHIDELALVDFHRSGLVLVGFYDPDAYIIVLRGRVAR